MFVTVLQLRKTFYLLKCCDSYTGPINLVPLLGGKIYFALPFPIFDLVHVQTIWSFGHRWPAVSPKQLLPGKWHYRRREQLLPEQLITRNLWYRSIISLHVHHAYLNIAQNIWVYSTLPHRAGWVFCNSVRVRWRRDSTELFNFRGFLPPTFCAFSAANVGAFFKCRLFL